MKAQPALNEINLIPWMQLLAILIGLVILFLVCTVKVQAGFNPVTINPAHHDSMVRPTDCLPKNNGPYRVRPWYVDMTDLSNESVETGFAVKNAVQKRGFLNKFFGPFKKKINTETPKGPMTTTTP